MKVEVLPLLNLRYDGATCTLISIDGFKILFGMCKRPKFKKRAKKMLVKTKKNTFKMRKIYTNLIEEYKRLKNSFAFLLFTPSFFIFGKLRLRHQ